MGSQYGYGRFSLVSRMVAVGLLSSVAAACSTDTMRFASDPFANPFGSGQAGPTATGSLPPASAAPAGIVQSAPLAAPSGAAPISAGLDASGWTRDGGFPIIVRQGETLTSIADRYGVPPTAILSVNGLSRAADLAPGSAITIPARRGGAQVASTAPIAPAPTVIAAPAQAAPPTAPARPALSQTAAAAPQAQSAPPRRPASVASQPAQAQRAPAPPERTATEQRQAAATAREASPPPAAQAQPTTTASLPTGDASGLDFRWPARGRVIAGFGAAGNEGINIALPEGTQVRAAETGVVAYAGSELKGYGNLVLIRHENGYVSAYAHNRDILVKRGDSVRRGQVIANSGRTGNVNAPQLHFEIRKGSDPVDPMPYLRG